MLLFGVLVDVGRGRAGITTVIPRRGVSVDAAGTQLGCEAPESRRGSHNRTHQETAGQAQRRDPKVILTLGSRRAKTGGCGRGASLGWQNQAAAFAWAVEE